jgi:hypothetical protein
MCGANPSRQVGKFSARLTLYSSMYSNLPIQQNVRLRLYCVIKFSSYPSFSPLFKLKSRKLFLLSFLKYLNSSSLLKTEMSPLADSYLAIPPGDHCLSGNLHTGETRGKVETIAEAPTYISNPHPGRGNGNILFYYPDVHGFYNNAMLLMDAFADAGYTVFGIDYFRDVTTTSNLPLSSCI